MDCSLVTYWYQSEDANDRKGNALVTLDQFLIKSARRWRNRTMWRDEAEYMVDNLLDAHEAYERADRYAVKKARKFYLEWKEKVILALCGVEGK